MNALSPGQMDDFLRQITTNDGLGQRLAGAQLTRVGTLTNTDGTPAVEWMDVLLYERALVVTLSPVDMGDRQVAERVDRELPVPTSSDPYILMGNVLDEYRREGWTSA